MLGSKIVVLATLLSFLFSGGGASGCRAMQNPARQADQNDTRLPKKTDGAASVELRVLAEGFHSSIIHPFVAVVRDAQTYAALVKLDGNLPKLDADFFKTNTVIAAY